MSLLRDEGNLPMEAPRLVAGAVLRDRATPPTEILTRRPRFGVRSSQEGTSSESLPAQAFSPLLKTEIFELAVAAQSNGARSSFCPVFRNARTQVSGASCRKNRTRFP